MKKKIIITTLALGLFFTGAAAAFASYEYFSTSSIMDEYTTKIENFIKGEREAAKNTYIEDKEDDLRTAAEGYFDSEKEAWLNRNNKIEDKIDKDIKKDIDDEYKKSIKDIEDSIKEQFKDK